MQVEPIGIAPHPAATPDAATMRAARGFEQLLVRQLAQTLVSSIDGNGADGADGLGGDDVGGPKSLYSEMLPDALSDAVDNAGGLGLAQSLAPELGGAA